MSKLFSKTVIGGNGSPYMIRWSLWLPFGCRLMLHHILRSDSDRVLHDHPWAFMSVVLWGGYTEQTRDRRKWRGVGSVGAYPAEHQHRVILDNGTPAWSLVLRGRRVREWGFIDAEGRWTKWTTYLGLEDREE
jgi:hypothetical protein